MRRDHILRPIVHAYRDVSWSAAALAMLGALALAAQALGLAKEPSGQLLPLLGIAACLSAALLLVFGQRLMRARIAGAAKASRDVMALAHRDALTGVATRSYFLETLRTEIYHGSDKVAGYLQLDLDNLKVLNDSAGHGAGDRALVQLADAIREVMPGALIGRLGGDEFGIAILGLDNRAALMRVAEELLRRLERPTGIGGRRVRLSASIGIALAPVDATDVDELISRADLALYKAKKAGRRCVVSFDPDMLGDERHRRFVERELRAALLLDEIELHYQPIFAADMTIKSHEALVRWRHQVRGTISPAHFIAIAEESDLIEKLGEWVLRRACLDLSRLSGSVSVNVSPAQLRHADFSQRFAAIIRETGADPHRLIIEITETVPLTSRGVELVNLDALRALGLRVAIDDFGAGYASLQYLRGFAFDIIKIDRTYVANLGTSRIDGMIVAAICDIARSLPVEVVAEGIETQEQLDLLLEAGCTGFQGFLLGRPQPLGATPLAQTAA